MLAVFARIKRNLTGPVQSIFLQVPRALAVSCLAAGLDFTVLVLLVERFHWHPLPAAVVSYLTGGVLQYYLCLTWVFPAGSGGNATGFVPFTLLSLVGLGITWLTMAMLYDVCQINYALAKIAALSLSFTWNFLSRKFYLFKPAQGQA